MRSTPRKKIDIRPFIPRVAAEDRKILAVCIGVAFVFWMVLNLNEDYSIDKNVIIQYVAPDDQLLLGATEELTDITITGQGWNLLMDAIVNPVIRLEVPVAKQEDGIVSKSDIIRLISLKLYSNNNVVSLANFSSLPIRLQPKAEKRVPLVLQSEINYTQGYHPVGPAKLYPDSIILRGAEEDLLDYNHWLTDTLRKESINTSFTDSLSLMAPPSGISLHRRKIAVEQTVEAFTEKEFFVPVEVRNAPEKDSFRIFPDRVRLKVAVLQSDYQKIVADSFSLVADLKGMRTEDQRNSIPLVLEQQPDCAVSVQYTPRAAEYFLIKKE